MHKQKQRKHENEQIKEKVQEKEKEKEKEKNSFSEINQEIFDDEFFNPILPITNLSRRLNTQINKINIDDEFDTSETHLNKDFEPFFNKDINKSENQNQNQYQNQYQYQNPNFSSNSYTSHSFYSSSFQEGQNEPKIESFEKSIFTSNKEGKKFGESKSKYENSTKGIKKEAHEKKIDDKTFKIIKENKLNSNEEIEHRVYKGITGEEVNDFESEFEKYKKAHAYSGFPISYLESDDKKKKKEKKHKQIKG
jgi:hypothetical protein